MNPIQLISSGRNINEMMPMSECSAASPLPRYRSHKEVWALKIAKFERRLPTIEELDRILNDNAADGDGIGGFITPADVGFARFPVSAEYVQKHEPKEGGYFVQYQDGYCSWSPADAFESGYTIV